MDLDFGKWILVDFFIINLSLLFVRQCVRRLASGSSRWWDIFFYKYYFDYY